MDIYNGENYGCINVSGTKHCPVGVLRKYMNFLVSRLTALSRPLTSYSSDYSYILRMAKYLIPDVGKFLV